MKLVKISELPLYESLEGLYTLGTDSNNESVKVPLSAFSGGIAVFDAIVEDSVDLRESTASSYNGIAYLVENKIFAAYVIEGSRYIYYTWWDTMDKYMTTAGKEGAIYQEKLYICDDSAYVWNGEELINIRGDLSNYVKFTDVVTTEKAGVMSAEDKVKLDSLSSEAHSVLPFDGIVEGEQTTRSGGAITSYIDVVWLSTNKVFAARVQEGSTMSYYLQWADDGTHPSSIYYQSSTSVNENKIFIYNGILYTWKDDDLVAVGESDIVNAPIVEEVDYLLGVKDGKICKIVPLNCFVVQETNNTKD